MRAKSGLIVHDKKQDFYIVLIQCCGVDQPVRRGCGEIGGDGVESTSGAFVSCVHVVRWGSARIRSP